MSQDDTPDRAAPQVGKVAPEAVALRAQPRPVTRLNRRTLAMFMGGLSVAVLGATIWSLQPHRRGAGEQTELYNVDRVSKSEGLDGLPADYSKLPQGPPLPGDLGPAIVASQQPVTPTYVPPGHDPEDALRKEADAAAASSVFFRSGQQGNAAAPATAQAAAAATGNALAGFDPLAACLDGGPACRPDCHAEPARPEGGIPERRFYGNPQFRQPANAGLAVSSHGRDSDRGCVGDGHQVRLAGRRDRHGDRAGL